MPSPPPSYWAALSLAIYKHKAVDCPCGHRTFVAAKVGPWWRRRTVVTCACGEQFTGLTTGLATDKLDVHHLTIAKAGTAQR